MIGFVMSQAAVLAMSVEGNYELHTDGYSLPVKPQPLPAYLDEPEKVPVGFMSHADRVRLSPIEGCACLCRFCDWPLRKYKLVDPREQLRALSVAYSDPLLPSRHVLVSGGTPHGEDEDRLERLYFDVIQESPFPVDVMLMPRSDPNTIERLVHAGVNGFSINLEIFDSVIADRLCKEKSLVGRDVYEKTIGRAVELTGGNGRVRSLLLVGVEPLESTLKGVEFIAALGARSRPQSFSPCQGN